MENVLASLAACSSYHVVSILRKKRQDFSDYSVEMTADRRDEPPRVFTNIHIKYIIKGKTSVKRLGHHELLKVVFTHGKKDISDELEEIYQDASTWPETNELKLLVVLDETRLLKAKNLVYCLNELGKRGVGFILITQYSTSIESEIRNVGTYFIMAAMSEREVQRFKDVTLHPSSKLITRLPRAYSFVFSPYWYPEPFFIRHRKVN
jgi:hypothetical protein